MHRSPPPPFTIADYILNFALLWFVQILINRNEYERANERVCTHSRVYSVYMFRDGTLVIGPLYVRLHKVNMIKFAYSVKFPMYDDDDAFATIRKKNTFDRRSQNDLCELLKKKTYFSLCPFLCTVLWTGSRYFPHKHTHKMNEKNIRKKTR